MDTGLIIDHVDDQNAAINEATSYTTPGLLLLFYITIETLPLKVAGRFWKDEKVIKADGTEVANRAIFQVFLIGSGLSIEYAVIGAKCIQWCLSENFLFAVFFGASLIPTTLILRYYPKLQNR